MLSINFHMLCCVSVPVELLFFFIGFVCISVTFISASAAVDSDMLVVVELLELRRDFMILDILLVRCV